MTYTSGARAYSGVQSIDDLDRLDLEAFVGPDGKRRSAHPPRPDTITVVPFNRELTDAEFAKGISMGVTEEEGEDTASKEKDADEDSSAVASEWSSS